jgi:glycosyltransferase involved in cell wall biosynthesis
LISPWPTVITVYDLSFVHYPAAFPAGRRNYLRLMARHSCRRADRVIAISESTRRDIVKQWGVPADKITVAYPGVGDEFGPRPAEEVAAFRQRRELPERFILHVGTLQPRKNLVRLIQAYRRLGSEVKLVLAGGRGWLYQEILAEIERHQLKNDVLLAGYLPEEELALWYNAAAVLAYPSLYEGFGFPVVEAMACGIPVVTSTVSSMPEAAGDAALLVDPHDCDALADALHQALEDQGARELMRTKGFQQAAKFSWNRTAVETVSAYQQVLGQVR